MSAQMTLGSSSVRRQAGIGASLDRLSYFALWGFLFSLPWEESGIFGHRPIGLALGLIAFSLMLLRIGVTWRRRQLTRLHFLMAAFVSFSVLSLVWTTDVAGTLERSGTYVQMLLVVWLIWEMAPTEERITGLLRAYTSGILVSCSLTLYNFVTGVNTSQLDASVGTQQWEQSRFSIVGINENDLGLMVAMTLPMFIYLATRSKGQLARWFSWLALIPCVGTILLTGSRGALVSAAIASVMLLLTVRRLPMAQKVAAAMACVAVAACAVLFVPAGVWGRLDQFTTEITEGTLTHRTLIWAAGLSALRDHPFFGVGSGAYALSVFRIVDVPYVAHNTFLSVLVELGVVGAMLLAVLLGAMYYTAWRMPYLEKSLWLTVLLSWSAGVAALTWEYRKPTWVMFGLLAAHAYVKRRRTAVPVRPSANVARVGRTEPVLVPAGPRDRGVPAW